MMRTVSLCILSITAITNVYCQLTASPSYAPIISGHWSPWSQGTPSLITNYTLVETYDMSQITEFCVYSGSFVDSIKVRWRNGEWSPKIGAVSGGSKFCEIITDDTCWNCAHIYRSDRLSGIAWCRYKEGVANNRVCGPRYGNSGSLDVLEGSSTDCVKALNITYNSQYLVGIQLYFETFTPQRPTEGPIASPTRVPVSGPIPSPTYNPIAIGYWSRYVTVSLINIGVTFSRMYPDDEALDDPHYHHITEICVTSDGTLVTGIKIRLRTGEWLEQAGYPSATEYCHALASKYDCYDAINIWKDSSFNAIQFRIQSDQSWTPKYGGNGGTASPLNNIIAENDNNQNECINALFVKSDSVGIRSLKAYFQGWSNTRSPTPEPSDDPTVITSEPSLVSNAPTTPIPTVSSDTPSSSPTSPPLPPSTQSMSPSIATAVPTVSSDAPTQQPTTGSSPPTSSPVEAPIVVTLTSKSPPQTPLYVYTAISMFAFSFIL